MQKLPQFRSGSATKRPAESRMLLSDVMEHRVPDLLVAQHRTAAIEEAEHGKYGKLSWKLNARTSAELT